MILPLRRRHRRMFAVIGILLPVAFVAGIAARKPIPTAKLATEVPVQQEAFTKSIWDRSDLFPKTAIRAQLLGRDTSTDSLALQFMAPPDFVKPDLLVYWLLAEPTTRENIPDDAVLLGAFRPNQPLRLPPNVSTQPGFLILYSLADQEIVETSKQLLLK